MANQPPIRNRVVVDANGRPTPEFITWLEVLARGAGSTAVDASEIAGRVNALRVDVDKVESAQNVSVFASYNGGDIQSNFASYNGGDIQSNFASYNGGDIQSNFASYNGSTNFQNFQVYQ